jgi:Rrf2 family protein
MKIVATRRSDYGIRAALCLASHAPEWLKAVEIAREMEIPRGFLPQVLQGLQRAGLVVSRAGRSGGYTLARDPGEISLLEVIEALEGPLNAGECALRGGPCRWGDVCAVHEVWSRGQEAFREALGSASLADVAAVDAALERGDYVIPPGAHRSLKRGRP